MRNRVLKKEKVEEFDFDCDNFYQEGGDSDEVSINKGYLSAQIITIGISMVLFGYSLTSWGICERGYFTVSFKEMLNDTDAVATQEYTLKSSFINTITLLGSGTSALTMGPLMSYGRRNCILLTNVLLITGALLCTVKHNYKVICVARFLFGAAAGAFSVFCPRFLAEIAPTAYKGPIGSLSQVFICIGFLVCNSLGFLNENYNYEDITPEL